MTRCRKDESQQSMNNHGAHHSVSQWSIASCDTFIQSLLNDIARQNIAYLQRFSHLLNLREIFHYLLSDHDHNAANISTIVSRLSEVAYQLNDWPLLIAIYQSDLIPNSAYQLINLYQHIGRYDLSQHTVKTILLANPTDLNCQRAWHHTCESVTSLACSQESDLWITPLSSRHLYDFAWQYNQSIQALCNLPVFTENDDWHYWLDDMQSDPYREIFAIFHQEWGFIGSVSLQLYDGIGFFYYWLGDDFQGMGLGPRAVELLIQWGEQRGMTCCYAKVYADNAPSHKAIQKIGFQPLPFTAAAPNEHEVFYYRGANKPEHQLFQGLKFLLIAMNSDIQPVPNQQTIAA